MIITIIGCLGAYPLPNGATSGYLIEEGNTQVLLECGSGVLSKLQQQLPLSKLDGVVISHYHPDHCADLGCLQYAVMIETQLSLRTKSFCAWGPGEVERVTYYEYCKGYSYEFVPSFEIGTLRFQTCKNLHEINGYAIKVTDSHGKTLVFSGDTGYYEGLAAFAANADCFLCESSFYAGQTGHGKQHLNAEQAGRLTLEAQAKLLVLTHLPHFGDTDQLVVQAGTLFKGEVQLARQWQRIIL
ncbi:MAG: MBL fold metallo-hydrolase [Anaerocolumna sp.]